MTRFTPRPFDERELALAREIALAHFGVRALDGPALVHEIRRVSALYNAGEAPPPGDTPALCARLRFFLPRDAPKLHRPLAELARVEAFPRRVSLRVLDLGAGLGTSTLGLARFLLASGAAQRVEGDAVDRDGDALAIARRVWDRAEAWRAVPMAMRTHARDLARLDPVALHPPYDVVLLGLVWSEMEADPGEAAAAARCLAWLATILPLVAPDGVLVIVEPALRPRARVLQRVRDVLAQAGGPPYVFAPCVRTGPCPLLARARDWCHDRVPGALSPGLALLARDAGLREEDLTYSYLTLHMQARTLREISTGPVCRVVGGPRWSKGKREWAVCGDGALSRLRCLDRDASANEAALDALGRGDVVLIPGGVDGRATSLRIGPAARVERLS